MIITRKKKQKNKKLLAFKLNFKCEEGRQEMIEKRRIKKLLRTVGGKRERREGGTSMVRNKGDREQPKSKVYGKNH